MRLDHVDDGLLSRACLGAGLALTSLLAACGGSTTNDPAGGSGGGGGGGGSGGGVPPACALEVEVAGELPPSVGFDTQLSGPAIVATSDGFMLGYRDQAGDSLRAVLALLKDDGDLSPPQVFDLGGCAGQVPSDGVSMSFAGSSGMLTASLPDCGQGAGAVFIPFESNGQTEQASGPRNKAFKNLWMAQGGSIAPAAGAGEWELIYRVQQDAGSPWVERVVLQGPTFKVSVPTNKPFGDTEVPYALVATSPQVRAFLAPVQGATVVKLDDRSSDTLDLDVTFSLPRAEPWAALVAWKDKVAVAIPDAAGVTLQPAVWTGGAVKTLASLQVGKEVVQGGALAVLRDHLFVVQGLSAGIAVHRIDGAGGSLAQEPAVSRDWVGALGDVSLTDFDGARIAAAAARNRVAMTWLTTATGGSAAPVGGWALLRCAE
ncbi:MAG: hypothetical protein IT377_12710 [Polyangiaceae bacterium]|nr:hypothetical protein [Polyangiaceae bacterium]